MRKNLSEVVQAWKEGRRHASGSLSTDGVKLYSYMLPIAVRANDAVIYIRKAYPSRTTQAAINAVASHFAGSVFPVERVDVVR